MQQLEPKNCAKLLRVMTRLSNIIDYTQIDNGTQQKIDYLDLDNYIGYNNTEYFYKSMHRNN